MIFLNELDFDFLGREPSGLPAKNSGHWFFGPGHLLIGGFYATNRFENIYEAELQTLGAPGAHARIQEVSGDYGIYVLLEQKFYEKRHQAHQTAFSSLGVDVAFRTTETSFPCPLTRVLFTRESFGDKKNRKIRLASVLLESSVSDNVRHATGRPK